LLISSVHSTWSATSPQLQSHVPSSTYIIIGAGSVLLLGAACGVWQWKIRQRDDEANTTTHAATKAVAVPEVQPRAEEKYPLVMDAKLMTDSRPQMDALARKPVLPVTMGDVVKTQRRPRPVSPPAQTGQTAAAVLRAAAAMNRQRLSRSRPVSPSGHRAPRHVTPPKPAAPRPVSPPLLARADSSTLATQATGNAFRTHGATGAKGRLPPRHARKPGNKRPVSPPITLVV
jgi:hypothetical protein